MARHCRIVQKQSKLEGKLLVGSKNREWVVYQTKQQSTVHQTVHLIFFQHLARERERILQVLIFHIQKRQCHMFPIKQVEIALPQTAIQKYSESQ